MDKHVTDIVAYLSWPGLLIALLAGDRSGSRFHLNQSLVIWLGLALFGFVGKIPLFGWLVCGLGCAFCGLCWFIGFINAIQGVEREVPVLGHIRLL